jgi:gas vesicle protein
LELHPEKSEANQKKLSEITQVVGEIKQQIRQITLTDPKNGKELLAKMSNLEKMMDDSFPDLIN